MTSTKMETLDTLENQHIVLVFGSHTLISTYTQKFVHEKLTNLHEKKHIDLIISRNTVRIDKFVEDWANMMNIPITFYSLKFNEYGNKGALIQNQLMVKHSSLVIVFWDAKSKSTKRVIDCAIVQNKQLKIYITKN